jgi:uncharacterized cupredoxin-like copper-binding protein
MRAIIDNEEENDMKTIRKAVLGAALLALSAANWAHEDDGRQGAAKKAAVPAEDTAFGRAGDAKKVTRTVRVTMNDQMRFVPDHVGVKRGDTIRFIVKNEGKVS